MNKPVINLARLGRIVIEQEVKNGRDTPALRFLTQTFNEIELAAREPFEVVA